LAIRFRHRFPCQLTFQRWLRLVSLPPSLQSWAHQVCLSFAPMSLLVPHRLQDRHQTAGRGART
jgi:hypothetical protein